MTPAELTPETFRDHVGAAFPLAGSDVALVLDRIDDSMTGAGVRTGGAFSLFFRGPAEPALEQATYRLTRDGLGEVHLFLVPVARTADGYEYEAAFN
jgi:hypothetical protein